MTEKRYTVLSYIINDYEILHEIGEKDPETEYIMVTDNPQLISDTWTVVYDPDLQGLSVFDKCYSIRFNCFKYANTNICVRIDGSMKVRNSLKPLIDIFEEGTYDICLMPHPFNHNFIDEYNLWVKLRSYPQKQAERCINNMRAKGYDFNFKGMFQGGFCILRRNELCRRIEKLTYNYLKELGTDGIIERIDQIPFSYILNTQFSHIKVLPVSEQIIRSYYIQLYEHHGRLPNLNAFYDREKPDTQYMFDREVSCLYLETPQSKVIKYEKILHDELKNLGAKLKEQKEEITSLTLQNSQLQPLKSKVKSYRKKISLLIYTIVILAVLLIILLSVMWYK